MDRMSREEIERMRAKLDELTQQLGEAGEEVVDETRERAEEGMRMARQAGKRALRYANEHPWVWGVGGLMLGLGIGMAVGARSTRSCDCEYFE